MTVQERTGVFELTTSPELPELFRLELRKLQLLLRTHTVGTVMAYDPITQTADVRIDIQQVVRDNSKEPSRSDPAPAKLQPPVTIRGMPVHFHGTQTAYSSFPIGPGDKGEVHISDRNLSQWLISGAPGDPVAMWTHALADGVFYPAPLPASGKLFPTDQTAYVIEGPLVKLGRLATSPVLKGDIAISGLTAYVSAVAAAYSAWLAATSGGSAPTAIANGAFIAALGTATAALGLGLPNWASTKALTE